VAMCKAKDTLKPCRHIMRRMRDGILVGLTN
jgi:hypothetical protein